MDFISQFVAAEAFKIKFKLLYSRKNVPLEGGSYFANKVLN